MNTINDLKTKRSELVITIMDHVQNNEWKEVEEMAALLRDLDRSLKIIDEIEEPKSGNWGKGLPDWRKE